MFASHGTHLLVNSNTMTVDLEAFEIKVLQLDFALDSPLGFKEIGSCDGLLCISVQKEGFILWNPWTGRRKKVPKCSPEEHFNDQTGFGYHHSTDDYKIIRL